VRFRMVERGRLPMRHEPAGRTLLSVSRHPTFPVSSVASGPSRRTLLIGSAGVAAAAAAALVVVFALGSTGSSPATATSTVKGAQRVETLLHGIPQRGTELGSPSAPVSLIEFADPQCPYCGMWARDALPQVVTRYVRTGKVLLVFEGMSFVGPDSLTALRTALAAGRQNRFWNVLELLFENQGSENTGWVTEPLLRGIGAAVPGLDTDRMLADRASAAVDRMVAQGDTVARSAGVSSTPTFAVGRTGGTMHVVRPTSLAPSALASELDAALKR
jgi:protein-disulfide isomerase